MFLITIGILGKLEGEEAQEQGFIQRNNNGEFSKPKEIPGS